MGQPAERRGQDGQREGCRGQQLHRGMEEEEGGEGIEARVRAEVDRRVGGRQAPDASRASGAALVRQRRKGALQLAAAVELGRRATIGSGLM